MKCQLCNHAVADGAPVYRWTILTLNHYLDRGCILHICARCAETKATLHYKGSPYKWRPAAPCRNCQRPVINDTKPRGAKLKYVVCSDECRRALYATQARLRRKRPMKPCTVCSAWFAPKRTDADYCSH